MESEKKRASESEPADAPVAKRAKSTTSVPWDTTFADMYLNTAAGAILPVHTFVLQPMRFFKDKVARDVEIDVSQHGWSTEEWVLFLAFVYTRMQSPAPSDGERGCLEQRIFTLAPRTVAGPFSSVTARGSMQPWLRLYEMLEFCHFPGMATWFNDMLDFFLRRYESLVYATIIREFIEEGLDIRSFAEQSVAYSVIRKMDGAQMLEIIASPAFALLCTDGPWDTLNPSRLIAWACVLFLCADGTTIKRASENVIKTLGVWIDKFNGIHAKDTPVHAWMTLLAYSMVPREGYIATPLTRMLDRLYAAVNHYPATVVCISEFELLRSNYWCFHPHVYSALLQLGLDNEQAEYHKAEWKMSLFGYDGDTRLCPCLDNETDGDTEVQTEISVGRLRLSLRTDKFDSFGQHLVPLFLRLQ